MGSCMLDIAGIGWVLPAGTGAGDGFKALAASWRWQPEDNAALAGFSAKDYLTSVKGYLDPAGSFCLAACALAMGESRSAAAGLRERSGISTITRCGSTLSGYRFTEQLLQKGPRLASPLIFPHSYANTPGNLAAIEFGFGGPHMVLYGDQDVREAVEFAVCRLGDGTADEMLVAAYESAEGEALPDGRSVAHGAVALLLRRAVAGSGAPAVLDVERLRSPPPPDTTDGMTAAFVRLLAAVLA